VDPSLLGLRIKNMAFERNVKFSPAFDKRNDDPSKNYGIGGVRIHFSLKGPKGGVNFGILTPMYLPHVREEWKDKDPSVLLTLGKGMGTDISYHSLEPRYEGQIRSEKPCSLTDQDFCYCDGGYIAGEDLFQKFLVEGDEAVWKELEAWYWENVEPKSV
jgi:hypothetical protein